MSHTSLEKSLSLLSKALKGAQFKIFYKELCPFFLQRISVERCMIHLENHEKDHERAWSQISWSITNVINHKRRILALECFLRDSWSITDLMIDHAWKMPKVPKIFIFMSFSMWLSPIEPPHVGSRLERVITSLNPHLGHFK